MLRYVQLPGLRMGYVEAGPADGAPVLLLHGFPEFHYSWRYQLPALAAAGYRAIAPDQRGYNLTDKTPPYDIDTLTQDIANLQDALGIARSHLVGHDWGGAVLWAFASRFPERVNKLIGINAPHWTAYIDCVRRSLRQLLKSYYIFLFQFKSAGRQIERNDFRVLERIFAGVKHMTAGDIARYKDAFRQPGAVDAALGWYRAAFARLRANGFKADVHSTNAPALQIWGERDIALEQGVNATLPRYVPHVQFAWLPNASHWVQMDEPDEVNRLMLSFLMPRPVAQARQVL
jgi:epoxide hydrolase 4